MTARVIHLLRHGPPERPGLLLGHTDVPALNPDCPQMRDRARRVTVDRVVASDLARCAVQAGHLARNLGVPLTLDRRWRELDFGAWDGMAPESLDPPALSRFWDDPERHAPPGGERWSDLRTRIGAALAALETRTLVVTHAGAMRAAISVLTGLDARGVWAFDLPYRAMLSLHIWPGPPMTGQIVGLATGEAR